MFNQRLREIRKKRGFTQQYMADALTIALRSYQRYEEGSHEPPFQSLVTIANVLNTSTDYLLGRDEFLESLGVSFDE